MPVDPLSMDTFSIFELDVERCDTPVAVPTKCDIFQQDAGDFGGEGEAEGDGVSDFGSFVENYDDNNTFNDSNDKPDAGIDGDPDANKADKSIDLGDLNDLSDLGIDGSGNNSLVLGYSSKEMDIDDLFLGVYDDNDFSNNQCDKVDLEQSIFATTLDDGGMKVDDLDSLVFGGGDESSEPQQGNKFTFTFKL